MDSHTGFACATGLTGCAIALTLLVGSAVSGELRRKPLEPVDQASTQATLNGFIDTANQIFQVLQDRDRGTVDPTEYAQLEEHLLRCLDLSEKPEYLREYAGKEAAVCLKEVFDRIEFPPDEEIPSYREVRAEATTDGLARWVLPHTDITIAKLTEGPRKGDYVFSADTVARATRFYERVKDLPYRSDHHPPSEGLYEWFLSEPSSPTVAAVIHSLPDWTAHRVYGQAIWQWMGLLLVTTVSLLVMGVAYVVGRWRAEETRKTSVWRYCVTLLFSVVAVFVPLLAAEVIENQLAISGQTVVVAKFIAGLAFLFASVALVVGIGNRVAEIIIASPRIKPTGIDAQFIRMLSRVLSLVAATIVLLEGGKRLGIPLSTLLASAGIGGLAVALAAQDSLKCLFGALMILLDKPYRAGERIIVGSYDGIVEDIGLRSTKLRLLTGHMACIPNEEMARSRIENVGRRHHIRRITDLHVPLDTPREKVQRAIEEIRGLLNDHEGMDPEFPPRVYFNDFNPDSFNIRIAYWFHPPKYWDFLAFSEKLNLEIFRAFDEEGIQFSLPFRVTYTTTESEQQPLEVKVIEGTEGASPLSRDPDGDKSRET